MSTLGPDVPWAQILSELGATLTANSTIELSGWLELA